MNIYSQVEYLPSRSGNWCGYCKSPNSSISNGMWVHIMTVQNYQNLIDRGWRRSGSYCYKPTMPKTCCPLYTIRCESTKLKLSKSQKKILKKMTKFLKDGLTDTKKEEGLEKNINNEYEGENISDAVLLDRVADSFKMRDINITNIDESVSGICDNKDNTSNQLPIIEGQDESKLTSVGLTKNETTLLKTPKPGDGMDPAKPQCKKAKILRLERKQKKLQQKEGAMDIERSKSNNQSKEKTLEDFIKESEEGSFTNKLELRTVHSNASCSEFEATFEESYLLYVKYQMTVHKDPPSKCTRNGYIRFLIKSPLKPYKDPTGPPLGYGSFHQQYWLNGKLIAVGVIDILPKCVSSIYFFYDPDYSFLSLGTYGALRELELVRSYAEICPDLKYYYMGFYIHSCPKMRYKARFSPSYLLCPEVYTWHRIEECIPILDVSKYSRLNEDKDAICQDSIVSLKEVLVLWNNTVMKYDTYRSKSQEDDEEEVKEYAEFVGRRTYKSMLLFRD